MIQNMKFTSFLFLLFFMQITAMFYNYNLTTNSGFKVWKIYVDRKIEEISFRENATYELKQNIGYLLINVQEGRCDIAYVLGAKLTVIGKMTIISAVVEAVNEAFRNLPELDIYIKKIRSVSGSQTYRAVLYANENEKIPKLYRVQRADAVFEVQMNCFWLKYNNVLVLYEGSTVTIFHSKPKESDNNTETEEDVSKIKIAFLLAEYIVKVEKLGRNSIYYLNDTEQSFDDAKKLFVKKIMNKAEKNKRRKLSPNAKKRFIDALNSIESDNYKAEGVEFHIIGSKECMMISKIPPLFYSLKSECIYLRRDYDTNEIHLFFGKKTAQSEQNSALEIVEKDYHFTKVQVTFIVEGNPLPTSFMISFIREREKYLRDSSKERRSSNK